MALRIVRNERSAALPFGVFDRAKAERGIPEVACVPGELIAEPDPADYYERMNGSRLNRASVRKYFLESSRGCWKGQKQHCSFCGLNGGRIAYRRKDPERVLAELRRGYREFGCRLFLTSDTVLDLNRMRAPLRTFGEETPDTVISFETVSTLTEEQVRFLADSGVMVIQSGIETLHPNHIRLLNKGNDTLSSIALLKFTLENRIQVLWNMLSGIPGDSPEEYRWVKELVPKIIHLPGPNWGAIRFDRFSLYWKEPERFNLRLEPMKGYRILMPEGSVSLDRWALFYDNRNPGACTPQKEIADVRKTVDEWYHDSHPAKYHLEFAEPERDDGGIGLHREKSAEGEKPDQQQCNQYDKQHEHCPQIFAQRIKSRGEDTSLCDPFRLVFCFKFPHDVNSGLGYLDFSPAGRSREEPPSFRISNGAELVSRTSVVRLPIRRFMDSSFLRKTASSGS